MIKIPLTVTQERFFRSFQKKIPEAKPFFRLTLTDRTRICGRLKGKNFFLSLQKKGLFSLFAPTLYGKVKKEEGKIILSCCVARPIGASAVLFLWCAFLIFTGVILVLKEPLFALCFLLPGVLFALPLFLFSGKDRKALLSCAESLAGDACKEE